jgi:hypothetical protein
MSSNGSTEEMRVLTDVRLCEITKHIGLHVTTLM